MSGMNAYYCTLAEAIREIRSKDTRDDAYLFGLLPAISRRLMLRVGRDFEPLYETRTFIANRMNIVPSQNALKLNDYLLDLESVSVGSTALTVGMDVGVYPAGILPSRKLYLLSTCRSSVTWYGVGCLPGTFSSPPVQISVTGWWGYKERYLSNGWLAADTIQDAALTDSATSFAVADVDGMDPRGFTPRFSPGQLLLIDGEMMRVVETDTTTDEVTVLRAQRGTEAAAHDEGALVKLWNVEEDIRRAAQRWASLQYQRKGVFETARIEEAVITMPADIPQEVVNIIERYLDGSTAL